MHTNTLFLHLLSPLPSSTIDIDKQNKQQQIKISTTTRKHVDSRFFVHEPPEDRRQTQTTNTHTQSRKEKRKKAILQQTSDDFNCWHRRCGKFVRVKFKYEFTLSPKHCPKLRSNCLLSSISFRFVADRVKNYFRKKKKKRRKNSVAANGNCFFYIA